MGADYNRQCCTLPRQMEMWLLFMTDGTVGLSGHDSTALAEGKEYLVVVVPGESTA